MALTGIVTYHHVPNFGAFIQAWSLTQAIQRLGHDVEVVDYRAPGHEAKFKRTGIKSLVPSPGRWRMNRFMLNNLPLSPTVRSAEEADKLIDTGRYDRLVCGSDQVWLKDPYLGFDRVFFLGVGETADVRRFSYAPSCGNLESYGEDTETARRLIGNLDAISVRDANTMAIVNSLGFSDVPRVVDPSLLADFDPLIGPKPFSHDYIVVTGRLNSAGEKMIRQYADLAKLKVVAAGTQCSTADINKKYTHAGEWVNLIKHAKLVITSLFHGAAVSVNLRKPFIAVDAAGRAFKLTDLLGRFSMTERFVPIENGEYPINPDLMDIDYSAAEPLLQADIASSRAYLKGALDG